MKKILVGSLAIALAISSVHASNTYGPFPVTVKGYTGSSTNTVSYKGQIARHVLELSLKKLATQGNGKENTQLKTKMLAYYAGKENGRNILSPVTKGEFWIKQIQVDDLSKDKNLKGKTYKGLIPGFAGQMTGPELVEFWIDKASSTKGGYDPLTGYSYDQLLSKFLMGAVAYNQAVDNYLDEKLEANTKPNNKPYGAGKNYTGKEHVWDEAFGYFGAPTHTLSLTPKQVVAIAKSKDLKSSDLNKDGKIDLYGEMAFGPAKYAAGASTKEVNYVRNITKAFIDGRELIVSAKGKLLSDSQRIELKKQASIIKTNWEKVLAEAAFKYAGETYEDLLVLNKITEGGKGDVKKAFAKYSKHWGELKGFLLALQTSGQDLGETAVKLNRLTGYGPVLVTGGQVTGIDANGKYIIGGETSMTDYMLHMVKIQKTLDDKFSLTAKSHDVTANMKKLLSTMGDSASAEND